MAERWWLEARAPGGDVTASDGPYLSVEAAMAAHKEPAVGCGYAPLVRPCICAVRRNDGYTIGRTP